MVKGLFRKSLTPHVFGHVVNLSRIIEREATRLERSTFSLAAKDIQAMPRDQEEKRAAISAAIAEANRVGIISQESMDAWVASWGKESELPPPEPDVDGASH
ncbi:MAG: hypothetical protein OXP66_15325 [Candidatus Tectomicrobia bacterium]|nr:hypothetical protein [Candidatus Tectomicrobia bacterium]